MTALWETDWLIIGHSIVREQAERVNISLLSQPWRVIVCVCVCVFSHTESKNFCFEYDHGFSSHRSSHCGCSSSSCSIPRSLFSLPGMFGRKGTLFPWRASGCVSHTHHVRACLGVTDETWRRWGEGDAHTKHTCITNADTLNRNKEQFQKGQD